MRELAEFFAAHAVVTVEVLRLVIGVPLAVLFLWSLAALDNDYYHPTH